MRRLLAPALLASLALSPALPARPDQPRDIEQALKASYEGKVLTLRNFYGGKKLRFNSEGKLVKGGKVGPWTLNGKIEVTAIRLRRDTLEIRGNRLHLAYDAEKEQFRHLRSRKKVRIELELGQDQVSAVTAIQAVAKVFLSGDDKLSDHVPAYWKRFLSGARTMPKVQEMEAEDGEKVYRIEEPVSPLRCFSCPDPAYPKLARLAEVEGLVVLVGVINKKGRMENLQIVEPLGLGLDDSAVETVRKWEFEPARLNGEAVNAFLPIEINFHLH